MSDVLLYALGSLAVAVVLGLAGVSSRLVRRRLSRETAHIYVTVPERLRSFNVRFGLLHVRDGKDYYGAEGPVLHQEILSKNADRRGTRVAHVRYKKHLGFQFKWFTDYSGITFEDVSQALENAGFPHVGKGAGKQPRIWFIHPDYSVYEQPDGIKNNFYYPS